MLFVLKSFRLVCLLILLPFLGSAQLVKPNTFGNVFIRSDGFMTIFGQHNFMEGSGFLKPGIVMTARTPIPGTINYSKNSGWSGASESQYVDGYVKSFHSDEFTFPIGQDGFYRPISLSKAYSSYAAYYRANPKKISRTLAVDVDKLSSHEYWKIYLNQDSKITLTWALGSHIDEITHNDQQSLTIVGLNSKTDEWEVIPSNIDEYVLNVSLHNANYSSFTKSKASLGSITSLDEVTAESFTVFSLASLAPHVLYRKPDVTIYPNPQLVGSDIQLDYKLGDPGGSVKVYKSDNSVLFGFELTEQANTITIPYPISESGSYIIGVSDRNGKTTYQNLIIVDQ